MRQKTRRLISWLSIKWRRVSRFCVKRCLKCPGNFRNISQVSWWFWNVPQGSWWCWARWAFHLHPGTPELLSLRKQSPGDNNDHLTVRRSLFFCTVKGCWPSYQNNNKKAFAAPQAKSWWQRWSTWPSLFSSLWCVVGHNVKKKSNNDDSEVLVGVGCYCKSPVMNGYNIVCAG